MIRGNVPSFPAIATALTFLVACVGAEAHEPEAIAETFDSGQSSQPFVQPTPCFALPGALAYVGPPRAYRRGPLPGIGVYVGPRALYPGTVAPWGSLPARFYAASYPLAYPVPADVGFSEYPIGKEITPFRPDPGPSSSLPHTSGRPEASPDPFAPEPTPPVTRPEPIPAPQPMDLPNSGEPSRAGGLINSGGNYPRIRPSMPKPGSLPRSGTGPREF
jgi:hypothetical protein